MSYNPELRKKGLHFTDIEVRYVIYALTNSDYKDDCAKMEMRYKSAKYSLLFKFDKIDKRFAGIKTPREKRAKGENIADYIGRVNGEFLSASAKEQEIFATAFLGETGLKPSESEMVIENGWTKEGNMSQTISFRRKAEKP